MISPQKGKLLLQCSKYPVLFWKNENCTNQKREYMLLVESVTWTDYKDDFLDLAKRLTGEKTDLSSVVIM